MNLNSRNNNEMTPAAAKITGWTGLAAMVAGTIFAGIQPIHPADVLASVTTGGWVIITSFKLAMCFLFLIGITGLYARQMQKAGWLGAVGYAMLMLSWALQSGFVFVEVFILPPLATAAPQFIDSYLGVVNGTPGEMKIGALVPTYTALGILYVFGGMAFGIATFRARVLPRWPAGLLAVTALLTPAAAFIPHEFQRIVAGMPMGIAFAWLGYSLWSERREDKPESLASMGALDSLPNKAR
jgi:hypothetical protein